jgi:hypothetical protein
MLAASGPGTDWGAVTAWATIILAVLGVAAVGQLMETRRSRNIETVRRLAEHWHSPEIAEGRRILKTAPTTEELVTRFTAATAIAGPDYFTCLRILDFFEEMGYSHRRRSRGFHSVEKVLGDVTINAWRRWGPFVEKVWPNDDETYSNFRRITEKLEQWRRFRARRHAAWLKTKSVLKWMVSPDYDYSLVRDE